VPTNKHATVRAPSLNIYRRRFEFHPQISTVPFLFLLNPQIAEISTAGADQARRDLLTIDVNYADLNDNADQDDFLLVHPLHRRTSGVNITTMPSEILDIVAAKVAKTSPTPLNDIVSIRRS
jgi:hypothetical protein